VTVTAVIYVPAYHREDSALLAACETFAYDSGVTVALPLRDVATVDMLLAAGWADHVIVARPHHAIVGWPVRVVSDVRDRAGATVVDLPAHASGGRHRAPSDSLIGRVMRHPTCEMPQRTPLTSAHRLIDNRVRQWAAQFPWSRSPG
jgi:hypothetical protein